MRSIAAMNRSAGFSFRRAALHCCKLALALSGESAAQPIRKVAKRPVDRCRAGDLAFCPKTVGRIEGRGSVTADGAATYEIPIWVSPGRAGVEPNLRLSYNSQAGTSRRARSAPPLAAFRATVRTNRHHS